MRWSREAAFALKMAREILDKPGLGVELDYDQLGARSRALCKDFISQA